MQTRLLTLVLLTTPSLLAGQQPCPMDVTELANVPSVGANSLMGLSPAIASENRFAFVSGGRLNGDRFVLHYQQTNDWVGVQEITAGTPPQGTEVFGTDVAFDFASLTLAITSAPAGLGTDPGRVHLYGLVGGVWVEQQVLTSPYGLTNRFGASVDIDGDRMVVGAPGGSASNAAIYRRVSGSWVFDESLDPALTVIGAGLSGRFGEDVAIRDNLVLAGDPTFADVLSVQGTGAPPPVTGCVWSFREDGFGNYGLWQYVQEPNPQVLVDFGASLDFDGEHLIVGAPLDSLTVFRQGAAHLYDLNSGDTFLDDVRLDANPVATGIQCGFDVAISGSYAVVGCPTVFFANQGEFHVYEEDASGNWSPSAGPLFPPGAMAGDGVGAVLEIESTQLLVVSPGDTTAGQGTGTFSTWSLNGADCPSLMGNPSVISESVGGTQVLVADAGSAFGGSLFQMLGSFSGTQPGIPIGSLNLPLVPDAYFNLLLTSPPPGFTGVLDSLGRAQIPVVVAPGAGPGLIGLTLNHAYLVFANGPTPGVVFASEAEPLLIIG